jgi:membrane fusion protein (multidrug efflux system)
VAGLFAEGRIDTGEAQAPDGARGCPASCGAAVRPRSGAWSATASWHKVPCNWATATRAAASGRCCGGLAAGDRILRSPGSSVVEGQAFEMATPVAQASAAASAPAMK